jgi:hypothetical protein
MGRHFFTGEANRAENSNLQHSNSNIHNASIVGHACSEWENQVKWQMVKMDLCTGILQD